MSTEITASAVKQLREMTGAGMMDCKAALTEAEGNFDTAIELLRKKGQKLSVKRADREAKEGVVIAKVADDKKRGIVIKLSSETDFVAKIHPGGCLAETTCRATVSGPHHNPVRLLEGVTVPDRRIWENF